MRKVDKLERLISPQARFWTGLTLIPGYFLLDWLVMKLLLVAVFAFLVTLAGKRIRYIYFLMMTGSITFFHLLTPAGRILWEIGPLKITDGSLETGVLKGITLMGLVFLSLFTVTPALQLPGKLGGLLGRMFYYFEEILDGRKHVKARDFIGSLDRILMEIFPPQDLCAPELPKADPGISYPLAFAYILPLEILVWGAVLIERVF